MAQPDALPRLRFGPFVLDTRRVELLRDGVVVPLRPKPYALLAMLVRNAGTVLTKEELFAAVWPGVVVTDDALTQAVHDLRAALGADGLRLLRTVARRGYRLDAEVTDADEPPTPAAAAPAAAASGLPASHATSAGGSSRLVVVMALVLVLVLLAVVVSFSWLRDDVPSPLARGGGGTASGAGAPLQAPRESLVVLPLQTQGDDAGGAWFADALTADLTLALGQMPGSTVISRDTAYTYKGRDADPREVARQLGVRYVVRGEVRRQHNDVRLTLTLTDGDHGRQLWAEPFVLDRADLPRTLDAIVGRAARTLGVELVRSEGRRAAALQPDQVQADDLVMQGYAIWFRGLSRENVLEAWRLFEAAVVRDPGSIRGWNGIALMAARAAGAGWAADVDAARARQQEAIAALQRLDPDHPLTLAASVRQYWVRADFDGLLRLAQAITERLPNHPFGHVQRGLAHINLGEFELCAAPLRKAIQIGPRDTDAPYTRSALSLCHWLRGEAGEALEEARLAVQANPGLQHTPVALVAALAHVGRVDEARRVVAEHQGRPGFRAEWLMGPVLVGQHPRVVESRQRLVATLREMGVPP